MLDSLAEPFSTVESAAGARAAADIGGRPVRFTRSAGPQACSAALGAVAVTIVGFDDGGYFSATWIWMTVCFAAVAAIGLLARGTPTVQPLAWLTPISLAALGTWMLASHLWGVPGTEAGHEAARAGMYLAALGAFLIVVERATVRAFLVGILAGILALECYALGQKAVERGDPDPTQGALLVGPIGYANALGILSAMATLVAIGLARGERRMAARAIFVAAATISLVALTLTSSRGAFVALGVGLLALTALQLRNSATLGKRHWCLAMVVAMVVAGGLLAIARPSLGDRPSYWRVATSDVVRHPVLGSGAGSFDDVWYADRPIAANARDAHGLYLEVLAELGPVGLVLLLGVLAPPLVAMVRRRGTSVTPIAAAAYAAFLVHAGLDWDWEVPATTLVGLACGVALLVSVRRRS